MPSFSNRSRAILDTCHGDLQTICRHAIRNFDFSVIEGHRSNERQDQLFHAGKSTLRAGESKHNQTPSQAVDIAPYPIDWNDHRRFHLLAGFMFQSAANHGIALRWGGDWDGDWELDDQSFIDLPHFEVLL